MSNFFSYMEKRDIENKLSDEDYMELAITAAERANQLSNIPIGATLAWTQKHLVEHNTVEQDRNPLNTASMNVIRKALDMMPHKVSNGVLYCTLEPDDVSVLAAYRVGINEVVFGAYDFKNGFVSSKVRPLNLDLYDVRYKGGVLAEKCYSLLPEDVKEYCGTKSM